MDFWLYVVLLRLTAVQTYITISGKLPQNSTPTSNREKWYTRAVRDQRRVRLPILRA